MNNTIPPALLAEFENEAKSEYPVSAIEQYNPITGAYEDFDTNDEIRDAYITACTRTYSRLSKPLNDLKQEVARLINENDGLRFILAGRMSLNICCIIATYTISTCIK